MNITEKTRISLQLGQVITLVVAVVGGASWAGNIEAKAESAKAEAAKARADLENIGAELNRHREMIATIQGDTRAILQLIKLNGRTP